MTEYDRQAELPDWARRLPKHAAATVFLFFVGGFGIREWLAGQHQGAGGLAATLPVEGWLIAWGVLLLIGNVAAWCRATS